MRSSHGVVVCTFRVVVLSMVVAVCGCTATGPPRAAELAAIKTSEKCLVLVRFNSTIDGEPIGGIHGVPSMNHWFMTGLANVDLGYPGAPTGKRRALTSESNREGWVYFVVPPGTYCLYVDSRWATGEEVPLRLEVPMSASVIYAGTVNVPVVTKKGALGLEVFGSFDEPGITVSNEAEQARALTASTLPDLGEPETLLMPRFDAPLSRRMNLSGLGIQAYRPVDFVTESDVHEAVEDSEGPDIGLAIAAGGLDMMGSAASSDSTGWAAGGGVLVAGAVVAGGLAISGIGALFDAAEENKWAPHFQEVAAEVVAFDAAGTLQQKLARRLGGHVELVEPKPSDWFVLVPHSSKPLLQVWVQALDFRAGPGGNELCLEVAFRARLWDPDQDRWAYDRILVYTNPSARSFVPPYATRLNEVSTVYERDSFRAPDGRRVVREELTRATNAAATHIAGDLRRRAP